MTAAKMARIDSPDALAELVSDCAGRSCPIVDYGLAHEGLGHRPPDHHVRLVQAGGLLEHYRRDMTVRVAAGMTLGDLQAQLEPHGQFLPIDADSDLTLGELINHNVYGPLRVGYGALRDLLLGLRYIDGAGRQIHVGGRTVKNVAGYDLTRFMVGSLGQFGIVYEATLRTYAIPGSTSTVQMRLSNPARLDDMLSDWLLTDAAPTWLSMVMTRQPDATVHSGFFGGRTACQVQERALEGIVQGHGELTIDEISQRDLAADAAQRTALRRWRRHATGLCKLIVPPASTGAVVRGLGAWSSDQIPITIEALPVHGCIFAGGGLDARQAGELDRQVAGLVEPLGGLRIWYQRPEGADTIDPVGSPPPHLSTLVRLKRTMDPDDLFNPGRFCPAA